MKLPSEAIKTMQLASKFVSWVKIFDSDFPKEDAQILELVSNIIDDVEEIEILTSTDKNLDLHKEFKNSKLLKNNKYRLLKKKEEKGNMLLVYAQKGKVIENLVFIEKNLIFIEKNLNNNKKTIIANVKGEVKLEKIADIIDLVEKQK